MLKKILAGITVAVLMMGTAVPQADHAKGASLRLKEAWALKKTSFKKETDIKRGILLKTVECYRSLIIDFPEAKAECAEACFRMGEIYRSLKMTEEAKKEFNRTFTYDKKGEFAARSLKEIGHISRRGKKYDEAITYYQRVQKECPAQRDQCADAMTWIGKVYLKMKEYQKARSIFLAFAEKYPEFPGDAIQNIDLAAGSLIDEGNREAASSLLAEWRQHFHSLLGKDKRIDKKIEKALERMKSPERLKE